MKDTCISCRPGLSLLKHTSLLHCKQVTIRGVALRTPSWELLHDLPWYKNASFKGTRGPEDVLRMRK